MKRKIFCKFCNCRLKDKYFINCAKCDMALIKETARELELIWPIQMKKSRYIFNGKTTGISGQYSLEIIIRAGQFVALKKIIIIFQESFAKFDLSRTFQIAKIKNVSHKNFVMSIRCKLTQTTNLLLVFKNHHVILYLEKRCTTNPITLKAELSFQLQNNIDIIQYKINEPEKFFISSDRIVKRFQKT